MKKEITKRESAITRLIVSKFLGKPANAKHSKYVKRVRSMYKPSEFKVVFKSYELAVVTFRYEPTANGMKPKYNIAYNPEYFKQ